MQVLGVTHAETLGRFISLVGEPRRRQALETLFREARGRRSSQLPAEFLAAIGADRVLPREEGEEEETAFWSEKPREEEKEREKPREETWAKLPYPSSFPVGERFQRQWKRWMGSFNELAGKARYLVEKKKVSICAMLIPAGKSGTEMVRCMDECLCERARHESWKGVETEKLGKIVETIRKESERRLSQMEIPAGIVTNERNWQNFRGMFQEGPIWILPNPAGITRARNVLNSIPAGELNVLRETVAAVTEECLRRVR
jgi:singapore isolate B (sub-type 7) whole genome shotgun sequence assembly, scaffold_9